MALANCVRPLNIDTDDIDFDKDFQGFAAECSDAFFYNHQGFRYNSSKSNSFGHAFIAKLCKYFENNWHILNPTNEVRFTKNSKYINGSKLGQRGKKVLQGSWREMYRVVKEAQLYLQECSNTENWWMKSITSSIGGEAYAIHIHDLVWSLTCLDLNYSYLQAETEQSYAETSYRKISDFHAKVSNLTRIHDEYPDRRRLIFICQQHLKAGEMAADDGVLTQNVEERNKLGIAKFLSTKLQATILGKPAVIGSRICSWLQIDPKDLIPFQRLIGGGSFGEVYEGSWLGVKVAVKEIPVSNGDMDYLAPEIAAHAKLQSPFVVQLIGICITETSCYFVMELVSSSLDKILEDRSEGHMPPSALPVVVDMMLQISQGMEYLHSKRIMHMDLKAANILIQPSTLPEFRDQGYGRVKICDFGHASLGLCSFRQPEDTKGACNWRAPEVFSYAQQDDLDIEIDAPKEYTYKADVYSFAMTCYEILTGKHPFEYVPYGKTIYGMVVRGERPSLPPSCPSVLSGFIKKCWDTDPNRRPCFAEISNFMRYMKLLIMRIKDSRDWVSLPAICRDFDKAQLEGNMALANTLTLLHIDTDNIDIDFQGFIADCLNAFFYNHHGFRYNSSQCNNLCHAFISKLCRYFSNNWHILSPTKEVRFTKNTKCTNVSTLGHRGKKVMQRAWKEMYRVVKEAQIYLQECSNTENWWTKSITSSISGEAYAIHIHDLVWSLTCLDLNYSYLQAETEQSYTETCYRKISDFHEEMSNVTRIHDEYHDRRRLIFICQQHLKSCEMAADDGGLTQNVEERNKLGIAKFLSAKLQGIIGSEPAIIGNRICSWLQIDSKDSILKQRYIGSGLFGEVYEGSWLGVKVALKEIPLYLGDLDFLAPRIAAYAKLQSPFVVQLIGICITQTHRYIVMELVSSTLDKIVDARWNGLMTPLALPVAVDIMLQISRGMEYLHSQRIIHMNLCTSKILIQPSALPEFKDHGYCRVKIGLELGSYGFSKGWWAPEIISNSEDLLSDSLFDAEDFEREMNSLKGEWGAPEVSDSFSDAEDHEINMNSPKDYTCKYKAHVYSFAMTCYEILTGNVIYDNVVPSESLSLPPSCPSVLADFIKKCRHTDPNRRPCFAEISNFMRYMKLLIMRVKDSSDCRDFDRAQLVKCDCNEGISDAAPNSVEEELIIRALEGDFPGFFQAQHGRFLQQSTQRLPPKIKVLATLPDYIHQYSYKEVQKITDNFGGEVPGVSSMMWKGTLCDGTQVAVKKQQLQTSMNEISMLCQMHHPNAVRLRAISAGYEGCLAFDRMVMGSLATKLFTRRSILNWTIRRKIGLGIARFLAHLHNDHPKRFLNVQMNANNVYLDERFTAKFGGFGSILPIEASSESLSSWDQQKLEVALQFEEFRNVQDFGVILLELLTGCRWESMQYSLQSIHDSIQGEEGYEFIGERLLDSELEGEVEMGEAMRWVRLGLWCFVRSPWQKPSMNKVVVAMEGLFDVSPLPKNTMFKSFRLGERVDITTEEQHSNMELSEMAIAWVIVKKALSDKLMTNLQFSSQQFVFNY